MNTDPRFRPKQLTLMISKYGKELQLKATICFIVDTMGKLKDVRIYKKEVSAYSKLDIELVKTLRQMRDWKPGKCNGKKVASLLVVPIGLEVQ